MRFRIDAESTATHKSGVRLGYEADLFFPQTTTVMNNYVVVSDDVQKRLKGSVIVWPTEIMPSPSDD